MAACPTLEIITGHQDIAIPHGRKNDPGGAFDWARIRRPLPAFTGHVGPLARPLVATPAPAATAEPGAGRAVSLNRQYASRLGWGAHVDRIVQVFGFTDHTPDERGLADAVARWQRAHGLMPDGVLGPSTWARLQRLVQAGAPSPGGTVPAPGSVGRNWDAVRRAIVTLALNEYEAVWARGAKKESHAEMRPVLLDYWKRGVGWDRDAVLKAHLRKHPERRGREEGRLLSEFFSEVPWSAVFVSWIMTRAGAGDVFSRGLSHWQYVKAAQANRKAEDLRRPVWAFGVHELSPIPGVVVVKARGQPLSWDDENFKPTHRDIVVKVEPRRLLVVGGNVRQSVSQSPVPITSAGKIVVTGNPAADHIAVLRLLSGRQ